MSRDRACPSVRLSVYQLHNSKTNERVSIKFFGGLGMAQARTDKILVAIRSRLWISKQGAKWQFAACERISMNF